MKKLSIILLAVAFVGVLAANAQVPRIRTSAPAEKTAQKGVHPSASSTQKADNKNANTNGAASNKNITPDPNKTATKKDRKKTVAYEPTVGRYMSIKSNIAYDAIALLNLAYECQIAKKWSAELPVMWSLWDWKESRGVRAVALQPGVKYWFSEVGRGNAIGVDFDLAWYNVRWNDNRYQFLNRPAMGASLVYAYTLNLGRGWKTEFLLGVGYVNTCYNRYFNIDNGAMIDTRTKNYFGPTRVGISLVYSL